LKPDVIGLIRDVRKPKSSRFRNQLYIFLVCLALAILFWVLVRLSRDYYHSVDFGLRYSHVPENLVMTGHSDDRISVKIRIQGYDVFSEEYLKNTDKILDISLKSMKLRLTHDGSLKGYLLTSGIAADIASQLSYSFEIYSITPDTLFFAFEKKGIRRIQP